MTATDRLRALLDERGVEYGSGFGGDTLWTGRYGIEWRWDKQEGTLAMYSHTITPEQAIAATLGNAGIDDALALLDEMNEQGRIEYGDYSQLHDEIATLGRGTCEMEHDGEIKATAMRLSVWLCSECESPTYNDMMPFYCQYCGARVERNNDDRDR